MICQKSLGIFPFIPNARGDIRDNFVAEDAKSDAHQTPAFLECLDLELIMIPEPREGGLCSFEIRRLQPKCVEYRAIGLYPEGADEASSPFPQGGQIRTASMRSTEKQYGPCRIDNAVQQRILGHF